MENYLVKSLGSCLAMHLVQLKGPQKEHDLGFHLGSCWGSY